MLARAKPHPRVAAAIGAARAVLEHAGVSAGDAILVAVSGGADSMALLSLLTRLRSSLGICVVVGHIDHGLRTRAAKEAAFVDAYARSRGLFATTERIYISAGADRAARARTLRRQALERLRVGADCRFVALGHTASDRAETLLLNLARGAGLPGLAAMPAISPPRVRPLIGLTRAHTREVCVRMGTPFFDDPTNDDLTQPRVAVRRRALATLEDLHPGAAQRMAATANALAPIVATLRQQAEAILAQAERAEGVIDLRALTRMHAPVQRGDAGRAELVAHPVEDEAEDVEAIARSSWPMGEAEGELVAMIVREALTRLGATPARLSRRVVDQALVALRSPGGVARFDLHPALTIEVAEGQLRRRAPV